MIHLDTSFLIHALVPASSADKQLRRWLRAGDDLRMSSIAWAELLCGPVGPDEIGLASSILAEIAPFTAVDGALAARSSTEPVASEARSPTA